MASLTDCNVDTCPISSSLYGYRPMMAANLVFLAIAAICLVSLVVTYIATRRWLAFGIAMAIACILDIIGYLQRVKGYDNPWDLTPFINGIICLTIAPVFISAAIYFCLGQVATILGRENSPLRPQWYTRIFITLDILSLAIQAAGGGLAFSGSDDKTGLGPNADTGVHVIVVGLAVQILSLVVFLGFFVTTLVRASGRRRGSALRKEGSATAFAAPASATPAAERPKRFKLFIGVLLLASVLVLVRCVYRVVEFAGGLTSTLAQNEGLFIGLDSVMIALALICLAACHPAIFLKTGARPERA